MIKRDFMDRNTILYSRRQIYTEDKERTEPERWKDINAIKKQHTKEQLIGQAKHYGGNYIIKSILKMLGL